MSETPPRVPVYWPPTPAQEVEDVKRRLTALGVSADQVTRLLMTHDTAKIDRQLDWLPYRKAKKPAALIVVAIDRDFDAPAALIGDDDGSGDGGNSFPTS